MNTRPIIAFLLLFGLLLCMPCIEAKQYYRPNQSRYNKKVVASRNKYNQKVIWMKKPGEGGLYTTKNYFISHGVGVTAAAMYYFGDVDNEGLAFHGGFNIHNLSLGAGLTFMYNLPAGNHCNMRFALLGGKIGGNNELKFNSLNPPRDDYRSFSAFVIAPSVGVQYYPFSNAGLFLYGGVSAAISIIDKYQFYRYVGHTHDMAANMLANWPEEKRFLEVSVIGRKPLTIDCTIDDPMMPVFRGYTLDDIY